jgi:hypothetical protein
MGDNGFIEDKMPSLMGADMDGNVVTADHIPNSGLKAVQCCLDCTPAM